jgi:hypothetical protein
MEKVSMSDLEEILHFREHWSQIDSPPFKKPEERIRAHLSLLKLQTEHMRLYSISDENAENFLTIPTGLIVFHEDNSDRAVGWKFPNRRAGTDKIQFEFRNDRIAYNSGKFDEYQKKRNPSADLVQVINALDEAKKATNPTDSELIFMAYENGVYLNGELETLRDNIQKTKTISLIDGRLGPLIKPIYSFSLDGQEAEAKLSKIEQCKIIEDVMRDHTTDRLVRICIDLKLIVDKDPRLNMVNYSKILLNEIESRRNPLMKRLGYMTY